MKWRRSIENLLLCGMTPLQVFACRDTRAGRDARWDDPVLVIRCEAKLGDNLLNVPFLRNVRATFPERPIHLLHHVAAREIYARCPYVDQRIEIDWPMSSPSTLLRRVGLAKKAFGTLGRRPDYAYAFVPRWDEDLYAPFLARMSGAHRSIGFSRKVLPDKALRNFGTDRLLTHVIDDRTVAHESLRPLRLLDGFQRTGATDRGALEFWFASHDLDAVNALRGFDVATRWVAIAPGAALDRRKWPEGFYAQIVKAIAEQSDAKFIFLGNHAERPSCETLAVAAGPGRSSVLAGQLSLAQCAAALSTCRLFVGNDSGLLHLAGAVGTPILEISCHPSGADPLNANSPSRFGPTVAGSVVLQPHQPLARECRDGCVFDSAHCIRSVDPADAIRAAMSWLSVSSESTPR